MACQVFVGDRYGRVLAELTAQVGPVSWQLNKAGKASLLFSTSDPKATEDNLRMGNRVLIQFDNGLPMWAGTMELPRTWTRPSVEQACYGIEYMLDYRITGKNKAFYSVPVGMIFQEILREAQLYQPLGIALGSVWMGGSDHSPRYHFKSTFDILTESLCKMEGCDFAFLPVYQNGGISFRAELYQQRGDDKRGNVALLEGANVGSATIEEQGPVVNHFVSIGSGSTWGDERQVVVQEDTDSIAELGRRENSDVFSGVVYGTTLDRHAATMIQTQARPRTRIALTVTNNDPGKFNQYDIGDIVRLVLPSLTFGGYDKAVRVLAREYAPSTGQCSVVVEEVTNVTPVYVGDGTEA